MNRTTTNDLIRYLFNETEFTDTVKIQKSIDTNYLVHEEFEELKETIDFVDAMLMEPSVSCIESIMSYSTMTAPLQVH